MAAITASMVAELRGKTDAPMMECKKALTEAAGDMAKAEELLRVKLGTKVNLTRFDFDPKNLMMPWHVLSDDGQVDLHFTPLGMHRELIDLKLIASNFKQLFGRFDGVLHVDGNAIVVNGMSGFVEDQYVKW